MEKEIFVYLTGLEYVWKTKVEGESYIFLRTSYSKGQRIIQQRGKEVGAVYRRGKDGGT